MGQYRTHVFVCTSGETCPTQGDVEQFVKHLRAEAVKAGLKDDVRINKAGCFSQCGHGPMLVIYPDDVWYAGVQASDLYPAGGACRSGGAESQAHAAGGIGASARGRHLRLSPARPARARQSQRHHPRRDERHRRPGDHDARAPSRRDLEAVGPLGRHPRDVQAQGPQGHRHVPGHDARRGHRLAGRPRDPLLP